MQRRLIRCVECNEIISMTEYDFSPEYRYDEEKDCFIELTKNDREHFVTKHKDHSTEELNVNGASFVSQSPYSDPLKTCYFEATNGRENFVIKRWRDTIEDPVEYELFKGHIEITDPQVEVQTTHIRRQIEAVICNHFEHLSYFCLSNSIGIKPITKLTTVKEAITPSQMTIIATHNFF